MTTITSGTGDHASIVNQYPHAFHLIEKYQANPDKFLSPDLWCIEIGRCFNCGDRVDYNEEWRCQTCDQRLLKERMR